MQFDFGSYADEMTDIAQWLDDDLVSEDEPPPEPPTAPRAAPGLSLSLRLGL